uniref:WRKY transcription factor n=1 Tax=Fagopyrum tataricum TaxID=62330 RepID=A0A4P9Q2T7_FAGTA|nr:WRKY transcription factor [Fagopyrum tataricum]
MAENDAVSSTKSTARPTIALPPRAPIESFFGSGGFGVSPGPMTLVSSFFSNTDPESEFGSFSQLLAGAMTSPATAPANELGFKQNRPEELVVTQPVVFSIPPGLSPACLLGSPGLFPGQGPFGMSHQQALAHVTAQAVQAQSNMYMQGSLPTSVATAPPPAMEQESLPSAPDSGVGSKEESPGETPPPSYIAIDKPANDGYNWRKYGQKPVKGSECPRSYYKCTHPGCPVKKKVERSHDGHVTEITYKGQHNHTPPQAKRGKDTGNPTSKVAEEQALLLSRRETESSQATGECLSGSEEAGDEATTHEDEPDAKRRNLEVGVSEPTAPHRTVTEPKIIVQTRSEVDLLDDGYRWRKYGQKVVKGNPNPRSYYKCTYQGCNVRKHIERASTDQKAVITTYEGKHNHDIPAPRASSHYTNMPQPPPRPHSVVNQNVFLENSSSSNDNHQTAFLQLKQERLP